VSARTSIEALRDIAIEIARLGEPANPALGTNLKHVAKVLDSGGTVFGYYGSGKSLLSILYSLHRSLAGQLTIVLEAYAILRSGGEVHLREVSPTLAALPILLQEIDGARVIDLIAEWLSRIDSELELSRLNDVIEIFRRLSSMRVRIPSGRIEKILEIANYLTNRVPEEIRVEHIVIDEFERLIANPSTYGYSTMQDLLEDVFMFADRKSSTIALSIPHTLRAMLDLETVARLEPMTQIVYEEQELIEFFSRFVSARRPDLASDLITYLRELGISFRVPRAVVVLATEAMNFGRLDEVIRDRVKFLCLVAYTYPTRSLRRRALLALLYVYSWLRQDSYAPVDYQSLSLVKERICSLATEGFRELNAQSRIIDYLKAVCREYDAKRIISEAYRQQLLERIGSLYVLSPNVVDHLRDFITKPRLLEMAIRSYHIRFEPKTLLIEMQL